MIYKTDSITRQKRKKTHSVDGVKVEENKLGSLKIDDNFVRQKSTSNSHFYF